MFGSIFHPNRTRMGVQLTDDGEDDQDQELPAVNPGQAPVNGYGVGDTPALPAQDDHMAYLSSLRSQGVPGSFQPYSQLPSNLRPPSAAAASANAGSAPLVASQLPATPPSLRSTDPFSKENRRQTLLSIGAAFLSHPDFTGGLGAAAQSLSGRMDALKQANAKSIAYGGPDGQFEITQNPDGTRSVRVVPEFAKAVKEKLELQHATPVKDTIAQRASAIHAIENLPPEQRSAAYADLIAHPEAYGALDTTGMPATYSPAYAAVMNGMGSTVDKAEAGALRQAQFAHKQSYDAARLQQGQVRNGIANYRAHKAPAARAGGASSYGSDLDY